MRHLEHLFGVIGSPAFAPDPTHLREHLMAAVALAWRPAGTLRQLLAVLADGDRTPLLPLVQAPTRIILETAVREYLECRKASIGAASRLFWPTAEQFRMGEAAAAANPLRGATLDPKATRNCRF